MRLRVGLLLCLFAVIALVGCRKPLAPNIDRNKAPETWITAAPFDTITIVRGERPQLGTIPIRFHVYWAGSDQDGAVVGYYWAVVETLPVAPEGGTPPLPGPRARDYHYTTRTDSTFIFNVAETYPDRQHAFFIYAVDDKGRPDPTPARFIFNALDRYPPIAVIDSAYATGTVYFFDQSGLLKSATRRFQVHDNSRGSTPPTDTVPSGSRVTFKFHGQPTVVGSIVKGFRYKLDEPEYIPVNPDSLFHGNVIEYHVPADQADPSRGGLDTLELSTGSKTFRLRVVDQANGSSDSTRRFQMNFSPDTWFAGPDPNAGGGPWQTNEAGEKFALLIQGNLPAGGLPGSLLSPDSLQILPVERKPYRTFFEIYGDTVFLRHEFDTIHLGAWVVIHNGGFDTDSPYSVHAVVLPGIPTGRVLTPDVQNGSPVGFRSLIPVSQFPTGDQNRTNLSKLYPFFDPNDVLNFPRIGAYHPMTNAGIAYSLQKAEDGDGARDNRVEDPKRVVDSGDPSLRPLVMVFTVDFPPVLKTGDGSFRPNVAVVDTFKSRIWDLRLPGDDRDPYVSGAPPGGPSVDFKNLRIRLTLFGKDTDGNPLSERGVLGFHDPPLDQPPDKYVNVSDINMLVPENLATGPATLRVELCDCVSCEVNPGQGRCITRDIQVYYVAP